MTNGLARGWYIILYHDVSWEETPFTSHIGGTCPPDVFRDHVRMCEELGELVSIQNGMERVKKGDIASPLFSFWFDDGFAGIRKYAAPILAARGMTGAMSICSRFATRTEMFWRSKLSYLHSIDGGRHLRTRLGKYGYSRSELARDFVIRRFGDEVLCLINMLYDEAVSPSVREDAFRIFDTPEGFMELHNRGWVIANHSAAHYPIGPDGLDGKMVDQFEECDGLIRGITGAESGHWVTPFGQHLGVGINADPGHSCEKIVVLVDDRVNLTSTFQQGRTLYRISAPSNDRNGLWEVLFAASHRSLAILAYAAPTHTVEHIQSFMNTGG